MTESLKFQLVDSMRALQAALDHLDAVVGESQKLGRNDWRCLHALVRNDPQSPTGLQKRLSLTSGSVTALLDRLERRGLIERHRDPADRRAQRIVPTRAAERIVEEASNPLESVTSKLSERWGAERSEAAGQTCLDLAKLVEWSARRV